MYGAHSQMRQADEDELAMIMSLKPQLEAQTGETYSQFEVVGITSQVVAGTIFNVKIRTDQGYLHMKVFRPLPHTGQPAQIIEVSTNQTESSPLM